MKYDFFGIGPKGATFIPKAKLSVYATGAAGIGKWIIYSHTEGGSLYDMHNGFRKTYETLIIHSLCSLARSKKAKGK